MEQNKKDYLSGPDRREKGRKRPTEQVIKRDVTWEGKKNFLYHLNKQEK